MRYQLPPLPLTSVIRKPEIIAAIKKFILDNPTNNGKAALHALLEREFQLIVTPGQLAGALQREGIRRDGRVWRARAGMPVQRPRKERKKRMLPPLPALASIAAAEEIPLALPRSEMPGYDHSHAMHVAKAAAHATRKPTLPIIVDRVPMVAISPPSSRPFAKPRECQWPFGEPRTPEFRFCCEVAEEGRPYCEEHCAVAYQGYRRERETPYSAFPH